MSKPHSGMGSRSIRHSSGRSTSASGVPRMKLNGRHLHRPDHTSQLSDAELVCMPARGEVHPYCFHPVRAPWEGVSGVPSPLRLLRETGATYRGAPEGPVLCPPQRSGSSGPNPVSLHRGPGNRRGPGSIFMARPSTASSTGGEPSLLGMAFEGSSAHLVVPGWSAHSDLPVFQ